MSLLGRLLGTQPDPREALRPLWHRVVEIAREPGWYETGSHGGGVADTVAGRFDVITLVLALVMLRMDGHEPLRLPSARLTELFVDDMDGQLRQSGVGDLVVGKRIGKLVSALGGRIDALRLALAMTGDNDLIAALNRNVTFGDHPAPAAVAAELRVLAASLAAATDDDLLAGAIAR